MRLVLAVADAPQRGEEIGFLGGSCRNRGGSGRCIELYGWACANGRVAKSANVRPRSEYSTRLAKRIGGTSIAVFWKQILLGALCILHSLDASKGIRLLRIVSTLVFIT